MDPVLAKNATDFKKKQFSNANNTKMRSGILNRKEQSRRPLPPQLTGKKDSKRRRGPVKPKETGLKLTKARSRFSLLATIVDFLKTNFMKGISKGFLLEDILTETNNSDVSYVDRAWLSESALLNNPRVTFENGYLFYKPVFQITDKRSLFRLLKHYDDNGLGGIYYDDIRESVGNADQVVRSLRNHISFVTRKDTDKDVIFLYDSSHVLDIDPEFIRNWKSVSLAGMEDKDIENELKKQGILMTSSITKKKRPKSITAGKLKLRKPTRISNTHLASDLLKDYFNK